MKAISLRRLALHLLLPEGEKQLNNNNTIQNLKKTGLTACLFLYLITGYGQQKQWLEDPALNRVYARVLNLEINRIDSQLKQPNSPEQIYIAGLADVLELLVTEDERKFDQYEERYESRLDQLAARNPQTAESLFTQAELRLQWMFTYLKFGHEFDAAWNIRQAYILVQDCKKKYPDFLPLKKTSGLLEIMLGSVPEKYQWVMSLLGMEGSVNLGLSELGQVIEKCESLKLETTLLIHLFQGFILQQTGAAMTGFESTLQAYPQNRLALFLGAAIAIKNSQSEKALTLLLELQDKKYGLPVSYTDYQLGEVYLHKGEYKSSIQSYQKFIVDYQGKNYIKDAHYKIGVCYWLLGDSMEASRYFEKAKEEGTESAEADKYAARNLAENIYPNIKLSKIRYATDGGYYEYAKQIAGTVTDKDIPSVKEKIEFTYRKARLLHKSGSEVQAQNLYLETITQQGEENWYFAPNACLQLGYLFSEQGQIADAKKYFEKALTYKKHEYKNSIDSKAKSALAQLKKRGV